MNNHHRHFDEHYSRNEYLPPKPNNPRLSEHLLRYEYPSSGFKLIRPHGNIPQIQSSCDNNSQLESCPSNQLQSRIQYQNNHFIPPQSKRQSPTTTSRSNSTSGNSELSQNLITHQTIQTNRCLKPSTCCNGSNSNSNMNNELNSQQQEHPFIQLSSDSESRFSSPHASVTMSCTSEQIEGSTDASNTARILVPFPQKHYIQSTRSIVTAGEFQIGIPNSHLNQATSQILGSRCQFEGKGQKIPEKNEETQIDNMDFSDDDTILAVNRTVNRSIVVIASTDESINHDFLKSKKNNVSSKQLDFRKKVHEFPACSMSDRQHMNNNNKNNNNLNQRKISQSDDLPSSATSSQNSFVRNGNYRVVFSRKNAENLPSGLLDSVGSYLGIISVDLSCNRFRAIPSELKQLSRLEILRMDKNLIREVPFWLTKDLLYLKELYFSDNLIQLFPYLLLSLHELEVLDLSKNRIDFLPEFSQLQAEAVNNLRHLRIQQNQFAEIPCSFRFLLDHSSPLHELGLDWFKYCSPPLAQNQFRDAPHMHSPLKKLSDLLSEHANRRNQVNYHQQRQHGSIGIAINFCEFVEGMSQQTIFSQQFNPAHVNEFGHTVLHSAGTTEDLGVIECLASVYNIEEQKSFVNVIDKQGHTALSLAILLEKYFSAKKLLQFPCVDVNIGGGIFGSALHIAAMKGQLYLIKDICREKSGNNSNINMSQTMLNARVVDVEGNTVLHCLMAVFSRDVVNSSAICELIIESSNCDVNQRNTAGLTPLHVAVKKSQYAAVKFAVEFNRKHRKSEGKVIQSKCCDNYDDKIFDFNAKGSSDFMSLLHMSCVSNDVKMTKLLLELQRDRVEDIDVFALNARNLTALTLPPRGNLHVKLIKQHFLRILNQKFQVKKATGIIECQQNFIRQSVSERILRRNSTNSINILMNQSKNICIPSKEGQQQRQQNSPHFFSSKHRCNQSTNDQSSSNSSSSHSHSQSSSNMSIVVVVDENIPSQNSPYDKQRHVIRKSILSKQPELVADSIYENNINHNGINSSRQQLQEKQQQLVEVTQSLITSSPKESGLHLNSYRHRVPQYQVEAKLISTATLEDEQQIEPAYTLLTTEDETWCIAQEMQQKVLQLQSQQFGYPNTRSIDENNCIKEIKHSNIRNITRRTSCRSNSFDFAGGYPPSSELLLPNNKVNNKKTNNSCSNFVGKSHLNSKHRNSTPALLMDAGSRNRRTSHKSLQINESGCIAATMGRKSLSSYDLIENVSATESSETAKQEKRRNSYYQEKGVLSRMEDICSIWESSSREIHSALLMPKKDGYEQFGGVTQLIKLAFDFKSNVMSLMKGVEIHFGNKLDPNQRITQSLHDIFVDLKRSMKTTPVDYQYLMRRSQTHGTEEYEKEINVIKKGDNAIEQVHIGNQDVSGSREKKGIEEREERDRKQNVIGLNLNEFIVSSIQKMKYHCNTAKGEQIAENSWNQDQNLMLQFEQFQLQATEYKQFTTSMSGQSTQKKNGTYFRPPKHQRSNTSTATITTTSTNNNNNSKGILLLLKENNKRINVIEKENKVPIGQITAQTKKNSDSFILNPMKNCINIYSGSQESQWKESSKNNYQISR